MQTQTTPSLGASRGAIMIVALVAIFVLVAITGALLGQATLASRAASTEQLELSAFQVAEGALDRAIADLTVGGSGVLGEPAKPITIDGGRGGRFYTQVVEVNPLVRRVDATGTVGGVTQRVSAQVQVAAPVSIPPAFENAIFSGNRSADPAFRFALGGTTKVTPGESGTAFAKRWAQYQKQLADWDRIMKDWPARAKAENARRQAQYQQRLAAWQKAVQAWDPKAAMAAAMQRYDQKMVQYRAKQAAWQKRMKSWTPPPGERSVRPPAAPRPPRKPTRVYPPRKPRPPAPARPPRKPVPPVQRGQKVTKRGDTVTGDIYARGDVALGAGAAHVGDVNTTGRVTGRPDQGNINTLARPWPLPDLQGMRYDRIAHVDVASQFRSAPTTTKANTGPESRSTNEMASQVTTVKDPRNAASIFAKGVLNDFGKVKQTTNDNFFLGDWHDSADGQTITITPQQNNKIYYIDGNLWVETNGLGPTIKTTDGSPVAVTFVVKGNLYMADAFRTKNRQKDGVMFIAMSDGESFTDKNGNSRYDPGEPILNDDGDGVYEGNAEGSGNVFWGDPNAGPLGTVDAFMYAENNFDDYALDNNGKPQPFTINGFMQAGNQVRINRAVANGHYSGMTVNYDARIKDGSLELPGMPESDNDGPVRDERPKVLAWRRVRLVD